VPGSITFEWLDGGRFVVVRSHNDHDLFPDAISVIGAPETGDGLVSLDDGVWRMWRDAAGFDQRFSATLGHDSFEGLFELATTPGDWKDDLKVTYRRVD
jgi:hypothetical protein